MGSSQSSHVSQTLEILNKSVTNLVTKNTNSVSARNANANSFNITFGEKAYPSNPTNCPLSIGQKITASQKVKLMAKFKSLSDLKTQMKAALESTVKQSSDSEQGAMALALNAQESKQDINTKISNIIETNITNETLNEVNGFLDNVNTGILEFKGVYPCPIKIDQGIVSEQIVEMLADAMVGNSVTTSTDSTISASSEQITKSVQKGPIGEIFGGIANIFSGPFKIIAIGCVVVAVIGLIGIIVKVSLSKKETEAVKQAAEQVSNFFGFGRKRSRFGRRRRW
jgi:hypothetical protein